MARMTKDDWTAFHVALGISLGYLAGIVSWGFLSSRLKRPEAPKRSPGDDRVPVVDPAPIPLPPTPPGDTSARVRLISHIVFRTTNEADDEMQGSSIVFCRGSKNGLTTILYVDQETYVCYIKKIKDKWEHQRIYLKQSGQPVRCNPANPALAAVSYHVPKLYRGQEIHEHDKPAHEAFRVFYIDPENKLSVIEQNIIPADATHVDEWSADKICYSNHNTPIHVAENSYLEATVDTTLEDINPEGGIPKLDIRVYYAMKLKTDEKVRMYCTTFAHGSGAFRTGGLTERPI